MANTQKSPKIARARLDQLVVERGLAPSRDAAQRLIRAGRVKLNGQLHLKPGHSFAADADVEVTETERFVGRGGMKLLTAFEHFDLDVRGKDCLDVGASTGGFTDCLLQHGARRVYAVDVGKGQLDWGLRNDARVIVMEGINARYLEPDGFDGVIGFATIDVSFISLTLILPAVREILSSTGEVVALIKPQFEAGREHVERGGVVRDPQVHDAVKQKIEAFVVDTLGMTWLGVCEAKPRGPAGNVEFLAYFRRSD